jgi:hypothetical protein
VERRMRCTLMVVEEVLQVLTSNVTGEAETVRLQKRVADAAKKESMITSSLQKHVQMPLCAIEAEIELM